MVSSKNEPKMLQRKGPSKPILCRKFNGLAANLSESKTKQHLLSTFIEPEKRENINQPKNCSCCSVYNKIPFPSIVPLDRFYNLFLSKSSKNSKTWTHKRKAFLLSMQKSVKHSVICQLAFLLLIFSHMKIRLKDIPNGMERNQKREYKDFASD